jgi:holo-[acyl-carrier protein] synthase
MNSIYSGIDIVEISRIREAVARWGERFLQRVYTGPELEAYRDKLESLAVRFAGKEAAMKALGSGVGTVSWREIEILSGPQGKPEVRLYGRALEISRTQGLSGLEISLSHSRDNAIALVIGVREG